MPSSLALCCFQSVKKHKHDVSLFFFVQCIIINLHENYKTLTDYIELKNFKLSAVRLQPSMDKMEKIDDYLYTEKVRLTKRIYKTGD